jgi:hypothetical protein
MYAVLIRKKRFRNRPCNIDIRIVPDNAAVLPLRILPCALIQNIGGFAEYDKTVCESWRHIEHKVVFTGELSADPFSVCRRSLPDINSHIKNPTLQALYQLALRMRILLKVKPPQNAMGRP